MAVVKAYIAPTGLTKSFSPISVTTSIGLIRSMNLQAIVWPKMYSGGVTTRPPYGQQWPRFAQYGSTI